MPTRNGTKAVQRPTEDVEPLPFIAAPAEVAVATFDYVAIQRGRFNQPGEAVQLGEDTYHLATLRTAGSKELQIYINGANFPIANAEAHDTPGQALVHGSFAYGNYDALDGLIRRAIFEDLPADIVDQAAPGQLIACVDAMLSSSGLEWLQRILKNSIAALGGELSKVLDQQIQRTVADAAKRIGEANTANGSTSTASLPTPSTPSS